MLNYLAIPLTIYNFDSSSTAMDAKKIFQEKSKIKAADRTHRDKLRFNISKYLGTVVKGKKQYSHLDMARSKAHAVKWKAIESLDNYLMEFERNFVRNGGQVLWAKDAEEARQLITGIIKKHNGRTVVKSKSMATEEIELNSALEAKGIEVSETDLGEFIVQMADEKPYHIVTPAMHKSKEDVAELFHEKLGTPIEYTPEQLTMAARKALREKYVKADIGITGANFIVADVGGIAITENEGNARLTTTFPKVHIALAGIERVLPSMQDLALFWPLLATYGTGQKLTVYNTVFTGPAKESEAGGPEHMYVILMDNGRSDILADVQLRSAMHCIRCGACLNVCPVYKTIGGHTYGETYSGPIGSVISPHFAGSEKAGHLSFASSLCGACTETCPVKIDLHELLLYNRELFNKNGYAGNMERTAWKWWRKAMLNRTLMNIASGRMKNFMFKKLFMKSWGKDREEVLFPRYSFNQQWKKKHG